MENQITFWTFATAIGLCMAIASGVFWVRSNGYWSNRLAQTCMYLCGGITADSALHSIHNFPPFGVISIIGGLAGYFLSQFFIAEEKPSSSGSTGGGPRFGRTRQFLAWLKDKSDAIDRHIRFLLWRLLCPVWRSFIRDSVPWGIATTVAFTGLAFVKPLTAYYSIPGVVVPNDVGFSIIAYALVGFCLFLIVHSECAEYDFYGHWYLGEETADWIRQKITRQQGDQTTA